MSSPDDFPNLATSSGETLATATKSVSIKQILAQNRMPNAQRNVTSTMSAKVYIGLRLRGIAIGIARQFTNGSFANDQHCPRTTKLTWLRSFIVELEERELLDVAQREQNVADMSSVYNQNKSQLKRNNRLGAHQQDANSSYCQEELQFAKSAKAEVDLQWVGRAQARGSRESTSDSTSLFLPQSEPAQIPSPLHDQDPMPAREVSYLELSQGLKRKGEDESPPQDMPSQTKRTKIDDSSPASSIQRPSSPPHSTSLPQLVLTSRPITPLRSTSSSQLISMPKVAPFQQSTAMPPPTPSQQSTAMPPPTPLAQTEPSPTFTSLPQPSPVPHPSQPASMLPPGIVVRSRLSDRTQDSVKHIKTARLLINGVVDASFFNALMTRLNEGFRFDPSSQHLRRFSTKWIIVDLEDLEDALEDVKEGENLLLEIVDGNVLNT